MPYIHFTREQKDRAASTDLAEFLRRRGEKLIRSGPEVRMASDHSVTIRGSEWYDLQQGGGPISFVQQFYNLSYPEAIICLLGGEQGEGYPSARERKEPPKAFTLPAASRNMRRLYAYLLQRRLLSREVVTAFVRAGLLYESCERSKDGTREYHNAVFVGTDENGTARHAHKRSIRDDGRAFRINVAGSRPQYSFHYTGKSDRLYLIEAPIDLLSFLTRYPKDRQAHSYAALCGTSAHAMLWMLERNPAIRRVGLCLDHDAPGIEAAGRLEDILREKGYRTVQRFLPEYKDWNEDLKAHRGFAAQEPEEHPQQIAAPEVCRRIARHMEAFRPDRWEQVLPSLIDRCRASLRQENWGQALDCMEQASALALAVYGRELRQMGGSPEELSELLCHGIRPHQNRGSWTNRVNEAAQQLQRVAELAAAPGIRSEADKRRLADSWLDLAVSFAKGPVKYEAEQIEQQRKLPQQKMEVMG